MRIIEGASGWMSPRAKILGELKRSWTYKVSTYAWA